MPEKPVGKKGKQGATPKPEKPAAGKREPSDRYTREQLHKDMLRGLITEPLISDIRNKPESDFDIIIALNETVADARLQVEATLRQLTPPPKNLDFCGGHYAFVTMGGGQILALAADYRKWLDNLGPGRAGPIYRVWKDEVVHPCLTTSAATIKAEAAQRSFNAMGDGIVWAVLDSGIDKKHRHFTKYGNVVSARWSKDFTGEKDPFRDDFGHGTHVAGIIAGCLESEGARRKPIAAQEAMTGVGDDGDVTAEVQLYQLGYIAGIAPKTNLVSLKVLDSSGAGRVSSVLRALDHIQTINDHGRRLPLPGAAIHGVNMSLGYDFNPRWFACGHSPICVEVDRLVRSGVVVVVAAGNSGFSAVSLTAEGANELGYRDASISDPGNSELAITVGSTHRERPHTYGVSYFSSRGPTGDGRLKPDLVAPGERIISCAAGGFKSAIEGQLKPKKQVDYLEQSGTSMAAPHVSGAIAAFLSVRREFIGQPEKVKRLFLDNTIDLKRERAYQGRGLLDLMKVLQAV
ncbi:MAG: S8 family peptidase [Bryobacteraceae bacterium]|nr:S8 family peptidase [Bryobacteraceae bacterium]